MALTNSAKTVILQNLLGQGNKQYSLFGTRCYIGLSTVEPEAASGSGFSEPISAVGGDPTGYERCLLGSAEDASTQIMTIADGKAFNKAMVQFSETVRDYQAGVKYFGLFSGKTDGTPYLTGKLILTPEQEEKGIEVKAGQIAIFSLGTSYDNASLKFTIQ